jgi:hypothetical protein
MSERKYKAFVAIPLMAGLVHVAFKLEQFRSPVLAEGPVDVLPLIQAEQPVLEQLKLELEKGPADLEAIAKLQSQVRLPEFISSYVDAGQKSNAIFDILEEEEFDEATIAETKVDLKAQNEILEARIAELEAGQEKQVEPDKEGE